jgi:hypothetical protein
MPTTSLSIVFNHRYEQNLPLLRQIYGRRFSSLTFLMPFPRSASPDVIPVYESSYRFQSFFCSAWEKLLDTTYDFFAFIGDDFILNPRINENNTHSLLNLDEVTSFISELLPLTRASASWGRLPAVTKELKVAGTYFKWQEELPSTEEAIDRFTKLGLPTDCLIWSPTYRLTGILPTTPAPVQHLKTLAAMAWLGRKQCYPLAWGYSDFVVVPRGLMVDFARYCRVLAAMGIFAEAAVPTALALSSPSISTEITAGWKSTIAWGNLEKTKLIHSVGDTVESLLGSFSEREIGKHPIKLSGMARGLVS